MAEDELADSCPFGDAPDFGDVGVQPGHPFQGSTGDAVPLEVAEVGDVVDEDAGPLGEGDQVLVHRGVAGEHDGAVRGVKAASTKADGDPRPQSMTKTRPSTTSAAEIPARPATGIGAPAVPSSTSSVVVLVSFP
jgi:hypothetical protein